MTGFKIAVIGAGSSYTPEILDGLASLRDRLPVTDMDFYDIDPDRAATLAAFCRRFASHLGLDIKIRVVKERREAIQDACFIITQIRVGGNRQRAVDERVALRHEVLGQETTGPAGMFKALRTIPPLLEIAREVEAVNPAAWMINYANPTGILAEAVLRFTGAKMLSLCAGGTRPRWIVGDALNVAPGQVEYDFFGLNHCNFAYNFTVAGRPVTPAEFERVIDAAARVGFDADLVRALGMLPISYMQYYFHRQRRLEQILSKERTRGEEVLALEKEIFAAYADPAQRSKPEALTRRGGGGYARVALGVIDAIYNNTGGVFVVNTLNRGATPYLPADASLEMPCAVSAAAVRPLSLPDLPRAVWGLVAAVKNYEQLTVDAAVSGDRDTARLAMMAHPLVGDWGLATRLFDDLLEANRAHLPQFF